MSVLDAILHPGRAAKEKAQQEERRRQSARRRASDLQALAALNSAGHGGAGGGRISAGKNSPGGNWNGIRSENGDDNLNQEYLTNLAAVQARAQDLDVNNPDIKGFHRARTAQILGKGVAFKHAPLHGEIGMTAAAAAELAQKIDRLRKLHSRCGGFDSQGKGRSEGKQQERAMLTALVLGDCLIHRVWRNDPACPLPLSLELIPASRISTPFEKMGDPLVSYGVQYADEHRSRVTGWWIRRVSKTVGNSFVTDPTWDFIPEQDGSLLSLTEIAGIDRALPLSTAVVRMLRNRGEFLEASVESARAQAANYEYIECAPDASPYDVAGDDASGHLGRLGLIDQGGVRVRYGQNGEKHTFMAAAVPHPVDQFMTATDGRCARGLVSSVSTFTRQVDNSWAGGRLEAQQDDPIIDQYRDAFVSAWQKVNDWFLEAVFLTSAETLPGYNRQTRALWSEFRATFFGKVHINPQQTEGAREMGLMHGTRDVYEICEEDGGSFSEKLRHRAKAMVEARKVEKEFGLPEGALDILYPGRTVSSQSGDVIGAPEPDPENQPGQTPSPRKKSALAAHNRLHLNRFVEAGHGAE